MSPYLFILIIDDTTKHIQDEVCGLFIYRLYYLIDEIRAMKRSVKCKGFKLSKTKVIYEM